ncbi:hypothetical protein ABPG74_003662 [Tetrahymena malaccensis]
MVRIETIFNFTAQPCVFIIKSGYEIDIKKQILSNLTGYFKPGLNAILGSSGAGKTTFLNILSKRIEKNNKNDLIGDLKINNQDYNADSFSKFSGYVMQEDLLLSNLTVKEYIIFAADIRLSLSKEMKNQRINNIIKQLKLEHCQNTIIGDQNSKGISGGEKKRCCIGIELIAEPQVLFLDEPTCGLDSFTAYQIIWILKQLQIMKNSIIIFTIHQPTTDIWQQFDRVLLLIEGQLIYQGLQTNTISYFSQMGYQCPKNSNPADYFMSLMSNQDQNIFQKFIENYNKNLLHDHVIEIQEQNNQLESSKQKLPQVMIKLPFTSEIGALLKRQILNLKRHRLLVKTRFIQVLINGIITGAIYWQLKRDNQSMQDSLQIAKCLYLLALGIFYQSMNPQVLAFTQERPVFLKEQSSQMYSIFPYFLSKLIPELFSCSLFAVLMSCIVYWMIGFAHTAEQFFFFVLTFIITTNVGNVTGLLAGSIFKSASVSVPFASTFVLPLFLFGGVFKNRSTYPEWIGWIEYINPSFYSFNALAENEFKNTTFIYNPIQIYHLNFGKWNSIFMLIVLYFCFALIAYLCLRRHCKKLQ